MTIEITGEHTTATVYVDELEENCEEQIQEIVDHEAFQQPIKIMPDTHWGKGAVIGFTMPFEDRVVPNTIGVDIGCGMLARKLDDPFESYTAAEVDEIVRDVVPMGFDVHDDGDYHLADDFPWDEIQHDWDHFAAQNDIDLPVEYGIDYADDLTSVVGYDLTRLINSIGTLGGGNHFIEFSRDHHDDVWVVVHSGSRGIGLSIANWWQELATTETSTRKSMDDVPEEYRPYLSDDWKPKAEKIREVFDGEEIQVMFDELSQVIQEHGPGTDSRNTDLDWLDERSIPGYLRDMLFAQRYASENRKHMLDLIEQALGVDHHDEIESVHNYIDFEDQIIRKGATPAREGEFGVVPFNMADGAVIIKGKGNPTWNHSAPHGAGRVMGRREAHRTLDVEDFEVRMEDVDNFNDKDEILDESPMAYKDVDPILERMTETATMVDWLKPVLNIKAED